MPYKDRERRRAYGRDWIERNAEKAREAMRRWRARHPEEHAAEGRAFHARHRDERNARSAAYHRANPQVRRAASQRRRARKIGAGGSFAANEWLDLVERYDRRCAYCGCAPDVLHGDHRTPLSRGGSNFIQNVLPACGPCNQRKATLTEEEFRRRIEETACWVPQAIALMGWSAPVSIKIEAADDPPAAAT